LLASLPAKTQAEFLDTLSEAEIETLLHDWGTLGRPDQQQPAGDWNYWMLLAGRGFTWTDLYDKRRVAIVSENLARELVELGCRGSGEILSRDEFFARKRLAETVRTQKHTVARKLASLGREKDFADSPLLRELAEREEAVRSGKLMVRIPNAHVSQFDSFTESISSASCSSAE